MSTQWFEELLSRVPDIQGGIMADKSSPTIPSYVQRAISHLPSGELAVVALSDVLWCMTEDKTCLIRVQAERHRLCLIAGTQRSRVDEDVVVRAIIDSYPGAQVRMCIGKRSLVLDNVERSVHITLDV
jgi:hypothetical protein